MAHAHGWQWQGDHAAPCFVSWGYSYLGVSLGWNIQGSSLTWWELALAMPWELSWGCLSPGGPRVCSVWPLHVACPSRSMATGFQEGALQGLKLQVSEAQPWKYPVRYCTILLVKASGKVKLDWRAGGETDQLSMWGVAGTLQPPLICLQGEQLTLIQQLSRKYYHPILSNSVSFKMSTFFLHFL